LETASQAGNGGSGRPANTRGFTFDRDVVAFYGDPAWQARLAPGPLAWQQSLAVKDGLYTLTIKPQRAEKTFEPINTNGSQRGYRPIVAYLPHRVADADILKGGDLGAVVADDFVLVPLPRGDEVAEQYQLQFRARPVAP
jgi:zinc protease